MGKLMGFPHLRKALARMSRAGALPAALARFLLCRAASAARAVPAVSRCLRHSRCSHPFAIDVGTTCESCQLVGGGLRGDENEDVELIWSLVGWGSTVDP